jgi:transposase
MERQALHDAVVRYNAEGLAGLYSRRGPGRRPRLDEKRRAALRRPVLDGPDVEATGLSAWTLPELCREVEERWGVACHSSHMGKPMRRLGLSRQTRLRHAPRTRRRRQKARKRNPT